MSLTQIYDHLAKLDWSAKGKRRKAYRNAKAQCSLFPAWAELFNAFDRGEAVARPEEEPEPPIPGLQTTSACEGEDAAEADIAAEAFTPTAYDDIPGISHYPQAPDIPRFVPAPPPRATPRRMDPFPSLIHGTGLDQIVATAPCGRLWRTWLAVGGWLLSTAMCAGILSYHLALEPAPLQVMAETKTSPAPADGVEIITTTSLPVRRITVKKYTDRVPQ